RAHHTGVERQQHAVGVIQALCLHRLYSSISRYLSPEPVLKSTDLSLGFKNPDCRNFAYAVTQAAPSGAAKIPSSEPNSSTARRISSSVILMQVPALARTKSRIKKSPSGLG